MEKSQALFVFAALKASAAMKVKVTNQTRTQHLAAYPHLTPLNQTRPFPYFP